MDNNNKITKRDSSISKTSSAKLNSLIQSLEDAERIAEYIVNSDTFGIAFEQKVVLKDKDGVPKLDKNNKEIYTTIKNKADVISAIILGSELGITPIAAITLGKKLDSKAYTKVLRGKKLGLDPMTAMDLIHIIDTQNGPVVSTGVHVISGVLLKNNIKFKYSKDFSPVYGYIDMTSSKSVEYNESTHYLVTKDTTTEDIQKAKKEGKSFVKRKIIDRETICELYRDGYEPVIIKYTLQDAINAELYKGITDEGKEVKGKPNWNNHPATMLRNRTLTIGGRLIAADYLDGMYSNEEAQEFTNYDIVDNTSEEVPYEEHHDESVDHSDNNDQTQN